MININKNKLKIKGTEVEIKAEITILIMGLYKEGYNKDDIFECMAFSELFNKENIKKFERKSNNKKRKYRKWTNF